MGCLPRYLAVYVSLPACVSVFLLVCLLSVCARVLVCLCTRLRHILTQCIHAYSCYRKYNNYYDADEVGSFDCNYETVLNKTWTVGRLHTRKGFRTFPQNLIFSRIKMQITLLK